MDPLSAIRSMIPALGNSPWAGVERAAGASPSLAAAGLSGIMPTPLGGVAPLAGASSDTFSSVLGRMVSEVNTRQIQAGDVVRDLQGGGGASLHQAVIAMEEASVSFQLMVEVRNKLLESYQELMRMQI